ncbi:MAG: carotenoid biosynthesis protein [Melioribacter sp.]
MNYFPKNKINESEIRRFVVIYYIVGVVGFILPFTRGLFTALIPISLLISVYLVILYHNNYNFFSVAGMISVFFLGYIIEVIGVQTGQIFGRYIYGNALGPKLFRVPLIIGINWLILSYASVSLLNQFKIRKPLALFLAPLLMVFYDFFLEQVAGKLDMWYWENLDAPVNNYIAWYIAGFVMVLILLVARVNFKNSVAPVIFSSQFAFFFLLSYLI